MARILEISFFSLCFLVLLYDTSGEEEGAAKRVLKEMGNLPGIVGEAFKLFETFENVYKIFSVEETLSTDDRLDIFNEKLDQLSSDIRSFEDRLVIQLEHQHAESQLDSRVRDLFKHMANIDHYYETFVLYTNGSLTFYDDDMDKLVENIISDIYGVEKNLREMHEIFLGSYLIAKNIPGLLRVPSVGQEHMCLLHQTTQQTINILYRRMLLTEVKGYVLSMYANAYTEDSHKKKTSHNDRSRNSFEKRMSNTFKIVKQTLSAASRELYRCDPLATPKEGTHYVRLGPVFQKYIMNEFAAMDLSNRQKIGCGNKCHDLKHVGYIPIENSRKNYCSGDVRNCQHMDGSKMSYCLEKRGSYRRYVFFMYGKTMYGEDPHKDCPFLEYFEDEAEIQRGIYRCDYCLCTCDNDNSSIARYFSLRPVLSDYRNNKVIVGARLKLNNNIFHIQMKQGKLVQNGRIEVDDKWTDVHDFTTNNARKDHDYYELTWDTNKILLDDFDSSSTNFKTNHVLTGLQFVRMDDQIKLGVYLSHFNYTSAILDHNEPKLITTERRADNRALLSLDNRMLPYKFKNNEKLSRENEYVQFTTSDLKADAGQHVLPFIDIQPVQSYPPSPLSGAGLFIRADDKKQSGGYLALKLFTMDTVPYMKKLELEEKMAPSDD